MIGNRHLLGGWLIALVSYSGSFLVGQELQPLEPSSNLLRYRTIRVEEGKLQIVNYVLAPFTETSTLTVPFMVDGVVEMQNFTETRTVLRPTPVWEELANNYSFTKLNNEKVDRTKVIERAEELGKPVVLLVNDQRLPSAWLDLLKDDVLIMQVQSEKTVEQFPNHSVKIQTIETDGETIKHMAAGQSEPSPIAKGFYFATLDEEEIEYQQMVRQIPMAGRQVLFLDHEMPISPQWQSLLKDDVVIMRRR